jgi:hypothetical protein
MRTKKRRSSGPSAEFYVAELQKRTSELSRYTHTGDVTLDIPDILIYNFDS